MGIAEKNNAQLYQHNGLTPNTHKVSFLEICTVKPIASYLKRACKLSWDTVLASTKQRKLNKLTFTIEILTMTEL